MSNSLATLHSLNRHLSLPLPDHPINAPKRLPKIPPMSKPTNAQKLFSIGGPPMLNRIGNASAARIAPTAPPSAVPTTTRLPLCPAEPAEPHAYGGDTQGQHPFYNRRAATEPIIRPTRKSAHEPSHDDGGEGHEPRRDLSAPATELPSGGLPKRSFAISAWIQAGRECQCRGLVGGAHPVASGGEVVPRRPSAW
jgi:hypothetical protein